MRSSDTLLRNTLSPRLARKSKTSAQRCAWVTVSIKGLERDEDPAFDYHSRHAILYSKHLPMLSRDNSHLWRQRWQ